MSGALKELSQYDFGPDDLIACMRESPTVIPELWNIWQLFDDAVVLSPICDEVKLVWSQFERKCKSIPHPDECKTWGIFEMILYERVLFMTKGYVKITCPECEGIFKSSTTCECGWEYPEMSQLRALHLRLSNTT
jgi:hypothetical protein